MPQSETILRVFVASPGEMVKERTALEKVIRELNITWSRSLGIRLDLIKWETDAYPGFGQDAQEVINRQIQDYDMFIGLMWKKFGTQTPRAGSGTQEEYQIAKAKFDENPNNIRIMFYFQNRQLKSR